MNRTCDKCGVEYDDAMKNTICPHPDLVGPYVGADLARVATDPDYNRELLRKFYGEDFDDPGAD